MTKKRGSGPRRRLKLALAGLTPEVDKAATRALELAIGGRDALREALTHVTKSPEAEILHSFLADPRNNALSVADLCRRANVSVPALWGLFKDGTFTRAQVAALARVAKLLPDVAEDLMKRAVEHPVRCEACHGTGGTKEFPESPVPTPCEVCQGTGLVPQVPELKRQEIALEMGGLLHRDKGGGIHVNVKQEQALQVAHVEQTYADFQRETDAILFEARPAPPPPRDVSS